MNNYIEYNNLLEKIVEKARQVVWKSYCGVNMDKEKEG